MSQTAIGGISNLWVPALPEFWWHAGPSTADNVMDADTEGTQFIGHCYLEAGTGSKTISSAGGQLIWMPGASAVFADAGTTIRFGIQDVSTTGAIMRGDGTFDVYHDMVGGTDTITSTTENTVSMSSGTKTITHGDLICVAWHMSPRGGADSVRVRCAGTGTTAINRPGVTGVTAGPTYSTVSGVPSVIIVFDDGTFGFISGGWQSSTGAFFTASAINTGTTPDEYAMIFQVAYPFTVDAARAVITTSNQANDFEFVLYSDPEGTPAAIETIVMDSSQLQTTGTRSTEAVFTAARPLTANTKYALAVRATTASSVSVQRHAVSNANHWKGHPMGTACYLGHRINQTGAFTAVATERIMAQVRISHVGTDSGGGGGQRIISG
jgi:hypothetical protein